jgi:competence protein ComFC
MRCLLCQKLSLSHICKSCRESYLTPAVSTRKVGGVEVVSFFRYSEIETLLHTKDSYLGHYILKILADRSFREFAKSYKSDEVYSAIPIDDRVGKKGYSHTALLTSRLKSENFRPCYNSLHSQSDVKYKGKSLLFRKSHSREFVLKRVCSSKGVVVDDIVTTGSTLLEAFKTLYLNGVEPQFALTLASVE